MSDLAEDDIEELVRRAVLETYPQAQREDEVDYVDARYEQLDAGDHLLRVRAPDHELLGFERWMTVTVDGTAVHLRGAGRSSSTEFYVRARIEAA